MFRPTLAAVDRCAGVLKRPPTTASPRSSPPARPSDPHLSGSRSAEPRVLGGGHQAARSLNISNARGLLGSCSAASPRNPGQSELVGGALRVQTADNKQRTAVVASFLPSLQGLLGCMVPSTEHMEGVFQGTTVGELESWLQQNGVDTSAYGSPPAKSIAELLEEVELGESLLQVVEGKLVRVVSVLNVFIQNTNGEVLMEEHQVRPCGTVRARGLPLSEKLKAGEDWHPAVQRAVNEELGSVLPRNPKIEIMSHTYRMAVETRTSNSYPGLHSEYHCHRVNATVEGLPQTQRFVSTEPRPNGILQNHWVWQPMAP